MNWSALPIIWDSIKHVGEVSLFSACVVGAVAAVAWVAVRHG